MAQIYMDWQKTRADPLMDGYPLMESPVGMIVILILYITAVFWGPRWMKHRKPCDLSRYTVFYNLAQICFCLFYIVCVYQLTEQPPEGLYLMCKIWDQSQSQTAQKIAFYQYINFICRVCELSETIVHILRKKTRNLSYLHVTHHGLNLILAWITTRFEPGGTASTICLINFTVHLIMYTYYFLAAQPSQTLKNVANGLKKYITRIQLAQFFYMLILVTLEIIEHPSCQPPTFVTYTAGAVVITNLLLFSNFYYVNYLVRHDKSK